MITPSKATSYSSSILSRIEYVLESSATDVRSLYEDTRKHFDDVDHFIVTLDVLFVLGRVNVSKTGEIRLVS